MNIRLRPWIGVLAACVVSVMFATEANAQRVALLAAEAPGEAADVHAKISGTGLFTQVDLYDVSSSGSVPSLATLLTYDAVLTWSDAHYGDPTAVGNLLADYVDSGRGVVQAVFSFYTAPPLGLIGGRWQTSGYSPFTLGLVAASPGLTLVPDQPLHPILTGVTSFDGGVSSFHHVGVALRGCGDLVAHWSNGEPLVATRRGLVSGQIVGLNLYPPSSDYRFDFWNSATDGARLMANALLYAATPNPPPSGPGPAVALLAADEPAWAYDVKCKLENLGIFSGVDTIDVRSVTPSLTALLPYRAVLTWSDYPYADSTALGDVLADFVDTGRGVVQSVFSFLPTVQHHIAGRWSSGGYRPLSEGAVIAAPGGTLVPDLPGHFILGGVSSFNGGVSSYHNNPVVTEAAPTVVASWNDGQPLVAVGSGPAGGQIVGLNIFPPSSSERSDFWDASTDGARLIANTLLFAANRPPSADAGADQSSEATSPAGASFTLNGTGIDPDGDAPLTFTWTGDASGSGASLLVTLPPPTAPAQSQTYTVTLTVSDGKGGETTDTIDLTVTDTTGPVLSNTPPSVITETATSASGAAVSYGPVTANDAVDGARAVACVPTLAVYPIGDTPVTCSSSDTRGNTTTYAFTIRVNDVNTPGKMHGDGFIKDGNLRYDFEFEVREQAWGNERARFTLQIREINHDRRRCRNHRDDEDFVAKTVDFVAFSDDPTSRPGRPDRPQIDTVLFSGMGRWNGHNGYRYEVYAVDRGEPGRHRESVRITITAPNGTVVASVDDELSGGNVQSERINHRHH